MNKSIKILAVVAALCMLTIVSVAPSSDAEPSDSWVLIDKGNGQTYWTAAGGTTAKDILTNACQKLGIGFASNGSEITVDGRNPITINGTTSKWNFYVYNDGWVETEYSDSYVCGSAAVAVGYYPSGILPTVTPEYKTAWTMIHGDSLNTGSVTNYDPSTKKAELAYTYSDAEILPSCYASPLYANGHMYLLADEYNGLRTCMVDVNLNTGEKKELKSVSKNGYALATGAIYDGKVYFALPAGVIVATDIDSQGNDNHYVMENKEKDSKTVVMKGASSIVYDAGHLFVSGSNGFVYCLTPELEIAWEQELDGAVYPSTSLTVANGFVYIGACDGKIYVLDETTGEILASELIYWDESTGGRVSVPTVMGDTIYVSYNDGQGMDCNKWGFAVLRYDSSEKIIEIVKNLPELEIKSNYQIPSSVGNYVFAYSDEMMYRVYSDGTYEEMFPVTEVHGGFTFVDNKYFYSTDYDSKGDVSVYNMDGVRKKSIEKPDDVKNYSMGSTFVAGAYVGAVTDSGAFVIKGAMVDGNDPEDVPLPTVKFLMADESGFYITVSGRGENAMDAFQKAVASYGYESAVEYDSPTNPKKVKSLFGLETEEIDASYSKKWVMYVWNGSSWTETHSAMDSISAENCTEILLYYGKGTDSFTDIVPQLPDAENLVPLKRSESGTRFLIQSESGMYFVMNGIGNTVKGALTYACERNSLPYFIDGDSVALFGISSTENKLWNGFVASPDYWASSVESMDSLKSSNWPVYGIVYGESYGDNVAVPAVKPSEIYDGKYPDPNPVIFVLADGSGFYVTIEGTGNTVIDAFADAVNRYGYKSYVSYSGSESNPTGILSMFGMNFEKIDKTHWKYWIMYNWDGNGWTSSSSMMNAMSSNENPGILLYYGMSESMNIPEPTGVPSFPEAKPLEISDDGSRFMLQNEAGMFFTMNGTGKTLRDAFINACDRNSIEYVFDGENISIFGLGDVGGKSWKEFSAKDDGWIQKTDYLSDLDADDYLLFGLVYGNESAKPMMSPSDVYNGPMSRDDGKNTNVWLYVVIAILVIILIAVVVLLVRIKMTQKMPVLAYIKIKCGFGVTDGSKIAQNKIRLLTVCTLGLVVTFVMFLCSLAVGPSTILSLPDTFSALVSAIGKGGKDLTFNEIIVYQSRLPRALAVLAVGIGLSIAGCVYQAIIRNPLVDPYIMGVSSGAGTFAVAAISANFTFFGLLSSSNYATPILAIMGGLLAFGLTLLIAEKSGGTATNYVLAGVVVGLVFSAAQTMLLTTSTSDKLTSAMSWLFGSFANVGWDTVWIIVFPALFMSIVPMFWAKELNLVLLGEDQAKQMGLNVRRFNRWMLILASVLTSICVAFVGIIGFVGMVIPHLSRMILGGDHRLVLPASIMMGGALMLFADLMAKMLMIPMELPVGAITTIIGVPVFAYLLIKKGRMYSG